MLSHLIIRNFAIIEALEIPLHRGFTVLTGETGAGKSIIIDALNLLLGGRATTEVIRTDEEEAVVEGIFEPRGRAAARLQKTLQERGIEYEGQLVVRRIVSRSGRNKVFLNGSLATVSALGELTRDLVDISGQHEHYSLVRVEKQIELLDGFAEVDGDLEKMAKVYEAVRALEEELESLKADDRQRLHRVDFLGYQLGEIDAAELVVGEEEEHEADLERAKHAEKIDRSLSGAVRELYEADGAAVERVGEALGMLQKVAAIDPALEEACRRLEEAQIVVEEVARDLQEQRAEVDTDPGRLDELIERLEVIKKLRRKHGSTIEEILENAEEMRRELNLLENAEEHTAQLQEKLAEARRGAWEVACGLSEKRRAAAEELQEKVEAELADLNMARARFVIDFGDERPKKGAPEASRLTRRGVDQVEFLLAANVGEEPRGLARIASGGELSRIMLAIKSVLVDGDATATYIFDEVDTGIGGTTAELIGEKLRTTAANHQVLCITHLASIASQSDHHYLVEKQLVGDRTQSTIRPLTPEERVEALAEMLSGTRVTQSTRDAARELLELSQGG